MYSFKIFYVIFTVNTKKILTEHTAKEMGKESKHFKKSINRGKNQKERKMKNKKITEIKQKQNGINVNG